MSTFEAIFFTSAGKTYVGYPTQGTYQRVSSPQNLADRQFQFNVAGLPWRNWPGGDCTNPAGAFGVLVGPAD